MTDVKVQFRMSDMNVTGAAEEALLVGYLTGNDPFTGSDSIVLVGPGDVTGDGFVGVSDLIAVLTNWSHEGKTLPEGDLTGDGFVGADDYVEVLTNWGSGGPPAPIPEPATMGMLLLGAAGIVGGRRVRVRKAGKRGV